MKQDLAQLEAIVRNRICGVCTDRNADGSCGMEAPSACALFHLFPQVAQAIQSVDSNDIGDYVAAIRQNVCSICADHASDGSCETRQEVRCALDAYLLLVVETIEEVTGKKFDTGGIAFGAAGGPGLVRPEFGI